MSRPLRTTDPSVVHLVTCRTLCAQFLMVPSDEVNDIIGGVFARYQEIHGVEIYALTVLSNHYHFISQCHKGLLRKFAADVNREIAKRINWHRGRSGTFWHRRYDDQPIIESMDLLEALLYVTTNPTHHGLTVHPKNWPGVNTYHQLLTGKAQRYRFTHWTDYKKAKKRAKATGEQVFLRDYQSEHVLKLTEVTLDNCENTCDLQKQLEHLIEKRRKEIVTTRERNNKGFLNRKRVLQQQWKAYPKDSKTSSRPACYTKNPEARTNFLLKLKTLRALYEKASILFRSGNLDTDFPPHTIYPPLHYSLPPNTS